MEKDLFSQFIKNQAALNFINRMPDYIKEASKVRRIDKGKIVVLKENYMWSDEEDDFSSETDLNQSDEYPQSEEEDLDEGSEVNEDYDDLEYSTGSEKYITSNEDEIMEERTSKGKSADEAYVNHVLPEKMKYNLDSIKDFSFIGEIKTMFRTVFAVLGKDYSEKEQKSRV